MARDTGCDGNVTECDEVVDLCSSVLLCGCAAVLCSVVRVFGWLEIPPESPLWERGEDRRNPSSRLSGGMDYKTCGDMGNAIGCLKIVKLSGPPAPVPGGQVSVLVHKVKFLMDGCGDPSS